MDIATDTLFCLVIAYSAKATLVMTEDFQRLWIPDSCIHGEWYKYELELFQELEVSRWVLDQNNLITY
jgi:hypothetical protein